jgi:hypothetical protein
MAAGDAAVFEFLGMAEVAGEETEDALDKAVVRSAEDDYASTFLATLLEDVEGHDEIIASGSPRAAGCTQGRCAMRRGT